MSLFKRIQHNSWVRAAVAFIIVACAIDYVWTRFVIYNTAMLEPARIHHLIEEDGAEIPIFGTSKAYYDYNPEILGDDVFNYGMIDSCLDVSCALLQIECKKHKQTPIVLDLTHNSLRDLGDPSKVAPFVWRPEIRRMLGRLGYMEWRYCFPGLRYFGYYDWYLKDCLGENLFEKRKTLRGFTIDFDQRYTNELSEAVVQRRLKAGYGFSSNPDQDRLLFDTIRSTPQRTFIIVFSPVHSSCFANFQDAEGFARYLDKLRSFTNAVVLDWGRMDLPDDCFSDTIHLNEKGAREFSRRFAEKLRTIRAAANPNTHNSAGAVLK